MYNVFIIGRGTRSQLFALPKLTIVFRNWFHPMIKRLDFLKIGQVLVILSQVLERHETDLIECHNGANRSLASMLLHGHEIQPHLPTNVPAGEDLTILELWSFHYNDKHDPAIDLQDYHFPDRGVK